MADKDKNLTENMGSEFSHERDDLENPNTTLVQPVSERDPDSSTNLDLGYIDPEYQDPNSQRTSDEIPDKSNINIPDGEDYRSDNESETSSVHSSHTMDSEMNEDEPEQAFCISEIISAPTQAVENHLSPTEAEGFTTFHLFSFLPTEIRQKIWIDALPGPRTIHILYNVLWDNFRYVDASFGGRWQLDFPYSIEILSACQESRSEAIKAATN